MRLPNRKAAVACASAVAGTILTSGALVWASRRLAVRKSEIKRWPVDQEATTMGAVGIGATVSVVGTGLGKGFNASRRVMPSVLSRTLMLDPSLIR